jgi:thiosulfate/3-mercaptopyruvate sulfurtransferase
MLLLAALMMAATYARADMLVDTEWLASHLADPDIRIVDMRTRGFEDGHIPGALHLANAAIRNATNPPTFLPSVPEFEALMGRLGISNTTRVVVYDDRGGIYATRLWWILNYHGHRRVALLNGGWVKWSLESRPTTRDSTHVTPARFVATPDAAWHATATDVAAAIGRDHVRIVDARTTAEIEGRDLRGIRRGGYIPTAVPLYWEDTLDPVTKAFKSADELLALFESRGLSKNQEIIAYCQVGMRAAHDLFALYLVGFDRVRNYYGSWEEWGNRDDLPVATTPAR